METSRRHHGTSWNSHKTLWKPLLGTEKHTIISIKYRKRTLISIRYRKSTPISIRYRKTYINLYQVHKNVRQSLLGTEKRTVISIRYRRTYSSLQVLNLLNYQSHCSIVVSILLFQLRVLGSSPSTSLFYFQNLLDENDTTKTV